MPLFLTTADQSIPIGERFVSGYSNWWGSDEPDAVLSRDRYRIETEVIGYNGAGGYWVREHWLWDRSGDTMRVQPRSLGVTESRALEDTFAKGAGA